MDTAANTEALQRNRGATMKVDWTHNKVFFFLSFLIRKCQWSSVLLLSNVSTHNLVDTYNRQHAAQNRFCANRSIIFQILGSIIVYFLQIQPMSCEYACPTDLTTTSMWLLREFIRVRLSNRQRKDTGMLWFAFPYGTNFITMWPWTWSHSDEHLCVSVKHKMCRSKSSILTLIFWRKTCRSYYSTMVK